MPPPATSRASHSRNWRTDASRTRQSTIKGNNKVKDRTCNEGLTGRKVISELAVGWKNRRPLARETKLKKTAGTVKEKEGAPFSSGREKRNRGEEEEIERRYRRTGGGRQKLLLSPGGATAAQWRGGGSTGDGGTQLTKAAKARVLEVD
ncbi:hypothetical protein ZIOFF_036166 [Zingiber officinale]|uniref:Uncharacterized protein n=1 Tax=Zingiber officinale TaxID=94328 RepID=A0A8J5GI77_ZINOF|nr:hypothetical protein ZIOFF_036166 [Zingiber officinale]